MNRYAAIALAAAALATLDAAIEPVPAASATKKYLETNCVIKAVVGRGLKGHGCNEWGIPHWVEVGQKSHPLPRAVEESVVQCGVHGLFGLVEYLQEDAADMPPPYDVIGGIAYFGDGCVKGVTEANVRLGRE